MPSSQPQVHIYGIRHHGPGSARALVGALNAVMPDIVLVEGPPDADALLPLAASEGMSPPVALLVYVPETPHRCVMYPFAEFSPEWQAIRWALAHHTPVRFMDLPQSVQLAIEAPELTLGPSLKGRESEEEDDETSEVTEIDGAASKPAVAVDEGCPTDIRHDPLGALAAAAGYSDGERWWDRMVEHRTSGEDIFAGILEAMTALRAAQEETCSSTGAAPGSEETSDRSGKSDRSDQSDSSDARLDALREAHMRQTIRSAQKEGFRNIAVVCGAWHGPALAEMGPARIDKALLDGAPKVKTAAAWVPWTYSRLGYRTGYGAGVESPGWYAHLWAHRTGITESWMIRVAHLLRGEDLDASPASVIEAVRLADTLAALRGYGVPGLAEMNEAVQTVLCFGSPVPMQLIAERLIVGELLGTVPDDAPAVPLQQDVTRQQRRLRLAPDASQKPIDLDMRKSVDLERSELLHRLRLLGVPWGEPDRAARIGKGTFHEQWVLQWHPEFAVRLIERGIWGNTVIDAATGFARHAADTSARLADLTTLVKSVLLARLPAAVEYVMARLDSVAAAASDIGHLMDALPPLADVARYGDVRDTDSTMIIHTIESLVTRISIGLAGACSSLDDDAAAAMVRRIASTHGAISVVDVAEYRQEWIRGLTAVIDLPGLHGRVGGYATRLLLDAGVLPPDEAGRRMNLAISTAAEPAHAAAWVEGFLMGSGLLLIHDESLRGTIDDWVTGLDPDAFPVLLPLLRRSFSTFTAPERRQLGERLAAGPARAAGAVPFDEDLAAAALPYAMQLLGLVLPEECR